MDLRQYVLDNKPGLVRDTLRAQPKTLNEVDDDGRTPLFWAVSQNQPETVSLLLAAARRGSEDDPVSEADTDTETAPRGSNGAVKLAPAAEAAAAAARFDINHADGAGWTVLHVAAAVGNPDILEMLLERHPDVNARTAQGQTALFPAVSKLHFSAVDALLTAGVSASAKDKLGQTCLQRAAAAGALRMVQKLLNHKVPVNASDNNGWTALHFAYADGHPDVALLLIRSGADTARETRDGETPEAVAVDDKIVKYVSRALAERADGVDSSA